MSTLGTLPLRLGRLHRRHTKDELEGCLKLRNTCGHPNSHKIGEHRVASHIETLMLNVFSQFKI
jgi:hypothetical protein